MESVEKTQILIITPDEEQSGEIITILTDQKNCLLSFTGTREALEIVKEKIFSPDIVIVEIAMVPLNGIGFAVQLKKILSDLARPTNLPIIFVGNREKLSKLEKEITVNGGFALEREREIKPDQLLDTVQKAISGDLVAKE